MTAKRAPKRTWVPRPMCSECGNPTRGEIFGGKRGVIGRACFLTWMDTQKTKGRIP